MNSELLAVVRRSAGPMSAPRSLLSLVAVAGLLHPGIALAQMETIPHVPTTISAGVEGFPATNGAIVAFSMRELDRDYNKNGSIGDDVLALYDVGRGKLTITRNTIGPSISMDGGLIAVELPHPGSMSTLGVYALQGNPFLPEGIHDTGVPGCFSQCQLADGSTVILNPNRRWISGGRIVFRGADLTEQIYDVASGVATPIGDGTWSDSTISGNIVAFSKWVYHPEINKGYRDVHFLNVDTGIVTDTGLAAWNVVLAEDGVLEYYYPAALRTYDTRTGQVGAYNWIVLDFAVDGMLEVYAAPEDFWGPLDANPSAYSGIVVYNRGTGRLVNVAVAGTHPDVRSDVVAFVTSEASLQEDLNGDGDAVDRVLRFIRVSDLLP